MAPQNDTGQHDQAIRSKCVMTQHREPVTIIGAGIVGLSCAFFLQERGHPVTVIDTDPEGDKASFGNAAGLAVTECVPAGLPGQHFSIVKWLLDPYGALFIKPALIPRLAPWMWRFLAASKLPRVRSIASALSALNDRTFIDYAPILKATAYNAHVHHAGALVAYKDRAAFERNALEWALKKEHGVSFDLLGATEMAQLEPSLGPLKTFGVFQEHWAHIDDPKELVGRLRQYLCAKGMVLMRSTVDRVRVQAPDNQPVLQLDNGQNHVADKLVIAAGAWSGALAKSLGDRTFLESERGYNFTLPDPGLNVRREIIFAEEKFVATPTALGLRVGGGAEFAGLTGAPNYGRCDVLLKLATQFLPGLKSTGGTRWMGQRPATPDSLPVISVSPRNARVFYAFGHGHLGLTQGPSTGRIIADLITKAPPLIATDPFAISRFAQSS